MTCRSARCSALFITFLTCGGQFGNATAVAVAAGHGDTLRPIAADLADHLGRMTGVEVSVSEDTAAAAVRLWLRDAGAPLSDSQRQRLDDGSGEAYLLRATTDGGIDIAGRTPLAVQHGCFDLLARYGWRWLRPGRHWVIVPQRPDLTLADLEVLADPVFRDRRIWYAYGCGIDASRRVLEQDYALWHRANRLGGLARFQCGHSYPHTVAAYRETFTAHPEYFAMAEDGTRLPFGTHQSLCYSHPEVSRIFIAHRLQEFAAARAADPYVFMTSMDPNDGSVACCCEPCRALGNGSDQVIYLANQVARALRDRYPDAAVGLYLYASHKLPPDKQRPEPNVYGQLAMGFNRTGLSYHELALGWRRQGLGALGIREYFGVMAWDWGLPGRGRGSDPDYMRRRIPEFAAWGATSCNAEINANWGTFGPAVYAAAHLMWDLDADVDELCSEYFRAAFGPGADALQELFEQWQDGQELNRFNLHRWLQQLARGVDATADADTEVHTRIDDMIAYLHYVVLYRDWERAVSSGDRDQAYAALRPMLTFTWRIRERQVMHAYALQRRLVNSGAPILRPLADGWHFKDPAAVWKDPTPVTSDELRRTFAADLAAFPPDERLTEFAAQLVPYDGVGPVSNPTGALRGRSVWHLQSTASATVVLAMAEGRLSHLELSAADGKQLISEHWPATGAASASLALELPAAGTYRLSLRGRDYRPTFSGPVRVVAEASVLRPFPAEYFGSCYVYVPQGVETILVKCGQRFSVQAPGWPARRDFLPADEGARECIEIPVGADGGKLWRLDAQTRGAFYFLNIPPYVGLDPVTMLLPADAVQGAPE